MFLSNFRRLKTKAMKAKAVRSHDGGRLARTTSKVLRFTVRDEMEDQSEEKTSSSGIVGKFFLPSARTTGHRVH